MDLSTNSLDGEISESIVNLVELQSLNLSENHLTGKILTKIGNMKSMLSLDLSRNNLSELIPPSLSELNFLEDLNLSFNNLSGRISTGSQLQTFTNASYIGNYDLCGPPTSNKCSDNITPRSLATISQDNEEEDNGEWCFLNRNSSPAQLFPLSFGGVSEVENIVLCSLAIKPEVRAALFQMKALSLPRPDGFPKKFYQTFWELIKEDLLNAINQFFQKGKLLR
ncbi:hypothetical protein QJS04_geneDACA024287 [Acorus gramineus]|uniref:Uncharacterized protein n=1 Tax=Acorus gramineus TaxID=55184 RepID=A0AAV8ZZT0_ACOGR|nr:hypothetical protein QJS04_geneDACA024287 [Acorus gramineus]